MAEKEGFEPSRPFRGLHDFQSCALDQLGDFSIAAPEFSFYKTGRQKRQRYYYTRGFQKVKPQNARFFGKIGGPKFATLR